MCLHILLRSSVSPIPVDGASFRDRHTSLTPLDKDPVYATAPGLCVSVLLPRSSTASNTDEALGSSAPLRQQGFLQSPTQLLSRLLPVRPGVCPTPGLLLSGWQNRERPQSVGCKTRARGGDASVRMRT